MSVQELNTRVLRGDPLWCDLCQRAHGLRDAKHRQLVDLIEHQQRIWSNFWRPRTPYPAGPACGDCEHMPCRCVSPTDLDLAWLSNLADHDALHPPTRKDQEHEPH